MTDLVINSAKLFPIELKKHIDRAYEEGFIDTFFINQNDINYYLQLGSENALNQLREHPNYSLIEDTISEMEDWACFQPEKLKKTNNTSIAPKGFALSLKQVNEREKKKKKTHKTARQKNRPKKK